jgi:sRNA-binding regulator protein Hfq
MLIYGHLISTFVLYDNMLIYGHLISTFVLYDNMLIYGHSRDRRGRDRMVVGFTTYVISAYHH